MNFLVHDRQIERAVRLVEYLRRLASLRTRVFRDIEDYEKVLWISDVPQIKGCFTLAWGPDAAYDSEIWVEVQNRREPELPVVPEKCKDWVDASVLRVKNDLPGLLQEIPTEKRNPAWFEGSDQPEFVTQVERLESHPEIQKAWDQYVEARWMPWVDEHNAWDSVHGVYSSLFSIHQELLRLGEEYELVLGVGLLSWITPTGQRVRRHLVVAGAFLEFDARLGRFNVRPNPDGAKLRPELDMLDIEDQPTRAEEAARTGLLSAEDDPWDKDCTEGVLRGLVHSINSEGEYHTALQPQQRRATAKPVVEFAPALILRKRSTKGLSEVLKRIKQRIEDGEPVPSEFSDLAEITASESSKQDADSGDAEKQFDGEIYFPKPSNDEQRRIVTKMGAANGVLVQGPPGTGKSHTIANLVCHLLATGNRILITAKTPRALQVLMGDTATEVRKSDGGATKAEGLIPSEIRPLCINLLGSGLEEKRSLESSVGGILREHETWDGHRAPAKLQQLEQQLHQLREHKSKDERRLRAIREAETHSQSIGQGSYRGTTAQIAETINRNRTTFEWLTDSVSSEQSCPIPQRDVYHILDALRQYPFDKRQELKLIWPDSPPAPSQVNDLFSRERSAIQEDKTSSTAADERITEHLSKIDVKDTQDIAAALSDFVRERNRLLASSLTWMKNAVADVVGGTPVSWREMSRATRSSLTSIESLITLADDTSVEFPDSINLKSLLEDASKLQEHVERGGTFGWGPFRSRIVKDRIYVLKQVRVNGRPCGSATHLSTLVDSLRVRVAFEKVWAIWSERCERTNGHWALQFQTLSAFCVALDAVFSLELAAGRCRETLKKCPHIHEPNWAVDSSLESLIASCTLACIRVKRQQLTDAIQELEEPLASLAAQSQCHPVTRELIESIRSRNIDAYKGACSQIMSLNDAKSALTELDTGLTLLQTHAPNLASELRETFTEPYWDTRVKTFQEAWEWAQAKTYIEDYLAQDDAPSLAMKVRQLEDDISRTIASIASLRAWSYCFSRLNEHHRRHMKAWQQNVGKLTKTGTGKQDLFHRREAQKNLNNCREAIPAWVMPLHRVWDTVDPAPGMFDVIIVDEASQCDYESLPLFYLGKKIVIVGDDKQIGPEAEAIKLDPVTQLIEQFLYDFEHKASFNITGSLFAHGQLRYSSNYVVLQEHFRCMPEIIRFSNDLCYRDTPLIPLRQYGPNRLEPIMAVRVEGYRQGSDGRAINSTEATSIAGKITELCRNPRYAGMTMGVVVLQGEAQGPLIESELLNSLGAEEMERRRLVCGNSYSFQGDQRDIMFLSMVAAPNERIGALVKAADERRFNVAASRARDQMWLYHSVTSDDLAKNCLRRRLLDFFYGTHQQDVGEVNREELERRAAQDNRMVVGPPRPFDSWFEVDVALALLRKDFHVIPQFAVAGRRIDLVIEGGHARLAVECDGDHWHGPEQYDADMQRQRKLERCKWEFFHVRESAFRMDSEKALSRLWRLLEERDIFPGRVGAHETLETEDPPLESDENEEEDVQEPHDLSDDLSLFEDVSGSDGQARRRPERITASEIQEAIIHSLKKCPNYSCTQQSLTSRVLRELGILTRGNPRVEFEKRVMRNLGILDNREVTERYRAKNKRVRLLKS